MPIMDRARGRVSLERVDLGQTNFFDANTETLAGHKTLVITDKVLQFLDPDGAKNVILPAESVSAGRIFIICNMASGSETITLQNDSPASVSSIDQNEMAIAVCDGTSWKAGVLAQT